MLLLLLLLLLLLKMCCINSPARKLIRYKDISVVIEQDVLRIVEVGSSTNSIGKPACTSRTSNSGYHTYN